MLNSGELRLAPLSPQTPSFLSFPMGFSEARAPCSLCSFATIRRSAEQADTMNPISMIIKAIQDWLAGQKEESEYWQRHDTLYAGGSRQSHEWQQLRLQVLRRDHYRCVRCGRSGRFPRRSRWEPFVPTGPYVGLHVHHVNPLSRGGSNNPENLETLCIWCHENETGRHLKGAR
jgi:5-methylcytosine-specific restriction endonuclease McrA